ncbi:Monothiol glutaredoxin-S12, chloroplastic [Grifola frondosa]|uniref:Monothiol glutaredoxin-S12, chloroplastic n=1 Tax=Grifola frondosa TaxID=5627 RepID=A0A1C7M1C3_GRIFR|nr:Monothiol glutaredoxin-S12, chloroplastic [Grifola frondosa]
MAHRRTYSARYPDMGSLSPDEPPLTPMLNIASLSPDMSNRKPRSYWIRTTFLALFVLLVVSVYILLIAQPALSPISFETDQARPGASRSSHWTTDAFRLAALRHRKPKGVADSKAARPQITLDSAQELAAVSSFIASLPQNMIPSSVDPSQPIDPQLILDFDTRSPQAAEEVETVVRDVWSRNPVVFYSKFYSPISREIKQLLQDMYIKPAPTIIEVDQRSDEAVLAPMLFRLTNTSELPILLVGGQMVGSIQEIRYLAQKGELQRMITNAGGIIDGARKKKPKKL